MASIRGERFSDLDITRDELEKIGDAMKNKEFVQLLDEYCKEVTNPDNIKLYQDEMTQLEKERGIDVTFINPEAGYVIKTSVDGNRKAYINICYNSNVGKPSSESIRLDNGQLGRNWQIPHMLAPPRDDFTKNDTKTIICTVYDVIFHPYTLHLASKIREFRDMVTKVALDSVEEKYSLKLDRKNLKFPKMKFKGTAGRASVVRKPIENFVKSENDLLDDMYPHPYYNKSVKKPTKKSKSKVQDDSKSLYATPKYLIKQRTNIDLEDFRETNTCKMNAAIPKELVIEIDLPLLKSTADTVLDVMEKSIKFISDKQAKYKLEIQLPYLVDENAGNAKFDKSIRKLFITLPVVRNPTPINIKFVKEDSGVDSDHESPVDEVKPPLIFELPSSENQCEKHIVCDDSALRTKDLAFLDSDIEYLMPEYTYNHFKNILAFTLHVKNVDPQSIKHISIENGIHLKFISVSSGYFNTYYALCVKFPLENQIDIDNIQIEAWDNNVIVQIPFKICDIQLKTFNLGLNETDLCTENLSEIPKHYVDESSSEEILVSTKYSDDSDEMTVEVTKKSDQIKTESIPVNNNNSRPDSQKNFSCSESSGDELSCSQSPGKSKGILKHRRSRLLNRSVSESSVDDLPWPNSLDNYNIGSDICIPEEHIENGNSFKKTVRFNDHVSKQIFRLNSSILGQKKKNQRKNRNKKRSHDRRHSESELSETEDKKDQFLKKSVRVKERPHSESELSETEHKDYFKKSALKSSSAKAQEERKRLDSGVCSDNEKDPTINSENVKQQLQDVEFQSDLIFDLDI